MDIEYLLLLQRFRESINDVLTPFFESISLFAVTYLIIVPAFVYWCVSKRKALALPSKWVISVQNIGLTSRCRSLPGPSRK